MYPEKSVRELVANALIHQDLGVSGANWGDDLLGIGANIKTDWRNPGSNGSFNGHSRGDGIFYRMDFSGRSGSRRSATAPATPS